MQLVYFAIYVAVGIAVDWAMLGRVDHLFIGEPAEGYLDLAYPRMIVSLVGISSMYGAGIARSVNVPLLLFGASLFCLSLGYAVYRRATGKERM